MESIILPPNPCLIGIALLIQARAGPRFVFHYPPQTRPEPTASAKRASSANGRSSTTSSDVDSSVSSDDDIATARTAEFESVTSSRRRKRDRQPDEDNDEDSPPEADWFLDGKPEWESFAGFPTDGLEKLLSPSRAYHKRRFELSMNDLVFLGWPLFVNEDGTWKKKKRRRRKRIDDSVTTLGRERVSGGRDGWDQSEDTSGLDEREGREGGANGGKEESRKKDGPPPQSKKDESKLKMFHVVFVLNPPATDESDKRVDDMYDNIVKKFSRALKYEQGRMDYVFSEAKLILDLKETAKDNRKLVIQLTAVS